MKKLRVAKRKIILLPGLFFLVIISAVAQPTAPADLFVIAEQDSNQLYWTQNPGAEGVTSYNIYRSTDSITFDVIGSVADSGSPTFTDTNVNHDQTYYYGVTAFNGTEGPFSNIDAGTPVVHFGNFIDFGAGLNDVEISDSDELAFTNEYFSFSFWLNVNTLPLPANEANLVVRYDASTPTPVETYFLRVTGDGELQFGEGGFGAIFTTASVIAEDTWYHIGVVYAPNAPAAVFGRARVYVDGVEVILTGFMANPGTSNGGSMVLGGDKLGAGRFLNGYIDELNFWNTDLAEADIQNLSCEQLRGDETNLSGLYHFNADDGNLYDYTVNQNNAELSAGVSISSFGPIASGDVLEVDEDSGFTSLDIQANDDFNGATSLETTLLPGYPLYGSVNLLNQDSIEYEPNPNYFGSDTIKYLVNAYENQKESCLDSLYDTASIVITVNPVNDAPIITDTLYNPVDTLSFTVMEDQQDTLVIFSQDIESDARSILSLQAVSSSSSFDINTPNDSSFVYTPELNFNGSDYLEIIIQDDGSPSLTDTAILKVDITPVNDAPVITDSLGNSSDTLNFLGTEDNSLSISLYNTDPENDNLSIVSVTSSITSALLDINSPNDTSFVYTPELNFDQTDTLVVILQDDGSPSLTDTAIVLVELTPINDSPFFTDSSGTPADTLRYTTEEDEDLTISLYNSDIENHNVHVEEVISINNTSTFNLRAPDDTSFVFTPPQNFYGYDTLRVVIADDGSPVLTDTAIVIVEVTPINDPPAITDADYSQTDTLFRSGVEDTQMAVSLYTTDIDGDVIRLVGAYSTTTTAEFDLNTPDDTSFIYTPEANFFGNDSIIVMIQDDGVPQLTDSALLILSIAPVNDAPEILNDNREPTDLLTFTTDEDHAITIGINNSDLENNLVSLNAARSVTTNTSFPVGAPNDTSFVYSPPLDFNGTDTVRVIISDDGSPALTDTALITIEVLPVNDPPEIVDSINNTTDTLYFNSLEDVAQQISLYQQDIEDDQIRLLSVTSQINTPEITLNNPDDTSFLYLPEINFNGNDILEAIIIDDGTPELTDTAILIVAVAPVNDAPQILGNSNDEVDTILVVLDENLETFCLNTFDPDGDSVFVTQVTELTEGNISVGNNQCLDIALLDTFTESAYSTVVMCDNGTPQLCDSVVIRIERATNQAPEFLNELSEPIDTLRYTITDPELEICFQVVDDSDSLQITYSLEEMFLGAFETIPGIFCFTPEGIDFNSDMVIEVVACDNFVVPACDTLYVEIRVIDETIPQGISPNGDQIGDHWIIPGILNFPKNRVQIYDQWGALVYRMNGYNNADKVWRGNGNIGLTISGSTLPDGTYFYMIDYGDDKKPASGFVVVKR